LASTATGLVGKQRNPLAVLLLSIVTIGIYGLYWYFRTFKEIKEYSGQGLGGVLGLILSLFCGIITIFLLPAEVGGLYQRAGREPPISGLTGFWVFLPIIGGIIWVFKVQGRLNDFWASVGG
jgi:hypothetical protein